MSETNEARKNQIAYMENVLGVSSVLRPSVLPPAAEVGGHLPPPAEVASAPHAAPAQASKDEAAAEWTARGDEHATLVFWHVGPRLTPALRELQDRMIKALKKDPEHILKIEAEQLLTSDIAKEKLRELLMKNPERTIVGLGVESAQMNLDLWRGFAVLPELKSMRPGTAFMIAPKNAPSQAPGAKLRFLPTHGLTHLENSQPLKKETWGHLQSLALS